MDDQSEGLSDLDRSLRCNRYELERSLKLLARLNIPNARLKEALINASEAIDQHMRDYKLELRFKRNEQ